MTLIPFFFQISWDGQDNPSEFTVEPGVVFNVNVSFIPKETKVYTGSLVFKPKGSAAHMNYTVKVIFFGVSLPEFADQIYKWIN